MNTKIKTASGINVIAGLWLIITPFLFGFGATNLIVIGIIVAVLSLIQSMGAVDTESSGISYINTTLGAWLIVSGFIMMASAIVFWNSVVLGIVVGGLALWSATSHPKMHPKM